MIELRRKVLIPSFRLTEVSAPDDSNGSRRDIKAWKGREAFSYYVRPVVEAHSDDTTGNRRRNLLLPCGMPADGPA